MLYALGTPNFGKTPYLLKKNIIQKMVYMQNEGPPFFPSIALVNGLE